MHSTARERAFLSAASSQKKLEASWEPPIDQLIFFLKNPRYQLLGMFHPLKSLSLKLFWRFRRLCVMTLEKSPKIFQESPKPVISVNQLPQFTQSTWLATTHRTIQDSYGEALPRSQPQGSTRCAARAHCWLVVDCCLQEWNEEGCRELFMVRAVPCLRGRWVEWDCAEPGLA